jgi:hypothetical protein
VATTVKIAEGQQKRIKSLIDEAGGQADFIRIVWGEDSNTSHKGKVSKWYNGRRVKGYQRRVPAGLDAAEAMDVATALGRNPAWLYWGPPQPERLGGSTSPTIDEDAVKELVARSLSRVTFPRPEWREVCLVAAQTPALLAVVSTALSEEIISAANFLIRKSAFEHEQMEWYRLVGKAADATVMRGPPGLTAKFRDVSHLALARRLGESPPMADLEEPPRLAFFEWYRDGDDWRFRPKTISPVLSASRLARRTHRKPRRK